MITAEIQADHFHLLLSIPPTRAVTDALKILKGTRARLLFQYFPALHKRLGGGHLCSPSYYVGTAGNVSTETIRRYIGRCEHVTKRR